MFKVIISAERDYAQKLKYHAIKWPPRRRSCTGVLPLLAGNGYGVRRAMETYWK